MEPTRLADPQAARLIRNVTPNAALRVSADSYCLTAIWRPILRSAQQANDDRAILEGWPHLLRRIRAISPTSNGL